MREIRSLCSTIVRPCAEIQRRPSLTAISRSPGDNPLRIMFAPEYGASSDWRNGCVKIVQQPFSPDRLVCGERIESPRPWCTKPLIAETRSQYRRGIHEKTSLWFCDRCNGARACPRWMRYVRGGWSLISPRGPVWSVSPGLLARPWKAGVLDTTDPAGPVWRVPTKLSPWAIRGLVLGELRGIAHA